MQNHSTQLKQIADHHLLCGLFCATSLRNFATATISILDAYGRTLDEQTSSLMFLQSITIDISDYAPGIYTLVSSTP